MWSKDISGVVLSGSCDQRYALYAADVPKIAKNRSKLDRALLMACCGTENAKIDKGAVPSQLIRFLVFETLWDPPRERAVWTLALGPPDVALTGTRSLRLSAWSFWSIWSLIGCSK